MSEHDPITLELIRYALQSIPEQIETDITRTAYSPLVYEYKDFAVGIVDAEGRMICQGKGGLPIFLANVLGIAVRDAKEMYANEGIAPGDVVISNDPATLGQHLNNVVMSTPVFAPDGTTLMGFMCVLVHWIDIGGRYVGSSASNDTLEIYQEGVQFHSVKLRRKGERVEEIYRMISSNTRFPTAALGDLDAQVAGCIKGRALFEETIARYGFDTVQASIELIWHNSANAARAAVAAIPDGTYHAVSFLDDDGVDHGKPIRIEVSVTVDGDRMIVDLSNCSPQVRGPFNSGRDGGGVTAARTAFKYLTTPDEATNEGSFAPLEVVLPQGTFLSASATAPMARYSIPLPTVMDTVIKALAPAMPGGVAAGHHSNMGSHRFQGINPRTGKLYSHLDTAHGGWGGSSGRDGAGPFKTLAHGDTLDVPIEAQEALYPLTIDRYNFRADSAGAGKYRGGLGLEKEYTINYDCKLTVTFDRILCPPWGLFGGKDGSHAFVELQHGGGKRERRLKGSDMPLHPGDRVFIRTGAGGGYGNPFERPPEMVAADVLEGYVTVEGAAQDYGVVIKSDGSVDEKATATLRSAG